MKSNSKDTKSSTIDVLLTTIHHLESVTEIYLSNDKYLITELIHQSNNSVKVYQYNFDDYLIKSSNFKVIEKKITEMLTMKHS